MEDLTYQPKFNCEQCLTKCDGHSKTAYIFEHDVALSEKAEDWLIDHFVRKHSLSVRKAPAQQHGLPDLEILNGHKVMGRVEVKAQGRAFMLVKQLLPQANLLPYETIALNLSDFERYWTQYQSDKLPIFIIWRVKRPCIGEGYWGQSLQNLFALYKKYGYGRRFRRKSTASDIVDGHHKGVTVNYHFSLKELIPLEKLDGVIISACFQNI